MNILFWSGGKDAYLALEFFRKNHPGAEIRLLTTYDEKDEIVPHQQIKLKDIKKQAIDLGLKLIPVPLPRDCPNEVYLGRLKEVLHELNEIEHLIFGDLYLEDIRQWREKVFGEMGYSCVFPIWKKSIHDLLPVLLLKPMKVKISAVKEEFQPLIRVGETYDQKFVTQLKHLPQDIDLMGENGEFHTQVIFDEVESRK